jgi:hypothetical protein
LLEIVGEAIAPDRLRAAAFAALGELPGVRAEDDVEDVAGRRGRALTWVIDRGFGDRVIFDPRTAEVLAQGEMVLGPPSTDEYGVPAATIFKETAYLGSGVVGGEAKR